MDQHARIGAISRSSRCHNIVVQFQGRTSLTLRTQWPNGSNLWVMHSPFEWEFDREKLADFLMRLEARRVAEGLK
jgi:hypothetical protein